MALRKSSYRLRRGILWLLLTGVAAMLLFALSQYTITQATAPLPSDSFHATREHRYLHDNSFDHARRALRSWEDSIKKGNDLVCALSQTLDSDTTKLQQSTWTDTSELDRYGWTFPVNRRSKKMKLLDDWTPMSGLNEAFHDLGISQTPNDWMVVAVKHTKETTDGDIVYPATNARYYTLWNTGQVDQPTLIAKFSYGPAYQIEEDKKDKNLLNIGGGRQPPPLSRWSDIVYLLWQKLTSGKDGAATAAQLQQRSSLTHVFRYNIVNQDSLDTIRRAYRGGTESTEKTYPPVFDLQENPDAFKSILSSPNAYGVAYLLASHKDQQQFGVRTIDRIQAFDCAYSVDGKPVSQMCLYIHLADPESQSMM